MDSEGFVNPPQKPSCPEDSGPAAGNVLLIQIHREDQSFGDYQFDTPCEIMIGRHSQSDIAIPGLDISRQHLRLQWNGNSVLAYDLSRNGVMLNGRRLDSGGVLLQSDSLLFLSQKVSARIQIGRRPMHGHRGSSVIFSPSLEEELEDPDSLTFDSESAGDLPSSMILPRDFPGDHRHDASVAPPPKTAPPTSDKDLPPSVLSQAAAAGLEPGDLGLRPASRPGGTVVLARGDSGPSRKTALFRRGEFATPEEGPAAEPPEAEPPLASEQRSLEKIIRKEKPVDPYSALKREIHRRLIDRLNLWKRMAEEATSADLRQSAERLLAELLEEFAGRIPPGIPTGRVKKEVLDEALGLGPLEDLLNDPDVSEIMVVGHDKVYLEREGMLILSDRMFSSDDALISVIDRIVTPIGRRIDDRNPMVDARLPDGSRINAIIPPISIVGPCLTIRKFRSRPFTMQELVRIGALNDRMALFLERCVKARKNIIVSGGTGSGKTTLLNLLASFIAKHERVVTIEDAVELNLPQEHVISLETRPSNIEGRGEVKIRDLLRNALRMRPDRILVGECRGPEALDMLQAMNTGHEGSLTTAHANSPQDLLSRLEIMVLQAVEMPVAAIREMIASTLDVIVQQVRLSDGRRVISSIAEVMGYDREEKRILLEDIFQYRRTGVTPEGRIEGNFMMMGHIPTFLGEFKTLGLLEEGPFI
jgi:pilus assembly protein CpaF